MSDEILTTTKSTFRLRDDGIVHIIANANARQQVWDAKENIAMIVKLSNGKPALLLVDIRVSLGLTREARDYYSGQEGLVAYKALALLISSPFTRVMANFFIKVNNPPVPTRLFTSEDEALAWLKTFLA